jgi:dTDP-4-dehydrorhamnose reductase
MKLLITGATGMVGSELLRQAMIDNDINSIIALSRKPLDIQHPKMKTVIHKDFLDYRSLSNLFTDCDVCAWCLGVSQLQVSKEEYITITHDYTMAAAKAMLAANPKICFVFVSGEGADQSGKTKTLFGRVKGKAEKNLMQLNFDKLIIARPAGIQPVTKNSRAPFLYKIFYFFYPVFKILTPSKVITSVELAKAILQAAKNKTGKIILDNKELKELSR